MVLFFRCFFFASCPGLLVEQRDVDGIGLKSMGYNGW